MYHYHNNNATSLSITTVWLSIIITTTKQHPTQHNGIVLEKVEKDETMAEDDWTNCPLSTDFSVKRLFKKGDVYPLKTLN